MIRIIRIPFVFLGAFMLMVPVSLTFNSTEMQMLATLGGSVLCVILVEVYASRRKAKKNAERLVELIQEDKVALRSEIKKHQAAVTRNLRNAIKVNDYGATVGDERLVVLAEFLASVGVELKGMNLHHALSYVESIIEADAETTAAETGFDPTRMPLDGLEFEHWVASGLRRFGWQAKATNGAGDQGVDVIAEKGGVQWAIQCKLYSQPVGNKAVQEAFSGAKYYGSDKGAVLTNAGYTESAKQLAASTGIRLLSPEDIPTLQP